MGLFKPGANKKAKEISKTNKGPIETTEYRGLNTSSKKVNLPVAVVKEKSKKTIAVGTSKIATPTVNYEPKMGQNKKIIKSYEGGNLAVKEKQGKDLLGRPVIKTRIYRDTEGNPLNRKIKQTLTKSGIQRKSKY
jgi:hypothetical protein